MKSKLLLVSGFLGSLLLVACLAGCGGSSGGSASPPQIGVTPKVLSTSPSHNEIDVKINRLITANFDKAIDPATLSSETFLIVEDETGAPVPGEVVYDPPSKTVTFDGDGDFSINSDYTATITEGVTDEAGNPMEEDYSWQFTTGSERDETSPEVAFTYPEDGVSDVYINTAIAATFTEPVMPSTINDQTFILEGGGETVAGSLALKGRTVLCTPEENLENFTDYTATLKDGIQDLAGNQLIEETWSFSTGDVLDTEPPTVVSVVPEDGATDVALEDPSIVITYSEPIKAFEFGLIDGRPVTVTFDLPEKYEQATLKPTVSFLPGAFYTGSVRSEDMAGNRMSVAEVWGFSTSEQ